MVALICAQLLTVSVAGADTASDLEAARQKVATSQAEANAAADELSRAEGRFEELQDKIGELSASIEQAQAQMAALEAQVVDRAIGAYVNRGSGASGFTMLFSTRGPMEAARRERFLDQANQVDNRVIEQLDALRADLAVKQESLKKQREEQQVLRDRLAEKNASVQASLAEANAARDELAARLEREQAAAAAAEAARIRAAQAASRPQPASPDGGSTGGGAGQIITNPGGGSFQCPVSGAAYSDNFGPRGSGFHYGIDMFASTGVPLVAVKSGTVSYMAMNGAGGNEAYLYANDGNVYYYAHQSQFVGGPRSVSQGEVIGLVGSTGNSTAPHLHFEIRLGGPNGQRIDPYPTLQSAGC
ncbi:MAG: peptidoglycan DD-metalloendopeptidase family protein [Acidimicrobiia bacterium]